MNTNKLTEIPVVLCIGRPGSHVGHRETNMQMFGVADDDQDVPLETLLNEDDLNTLIGKPIQLNHIDYDIGVVDKVEIIEGLPYAVGRVWGDIVSLMQGAKEDGLTLETSPTFMASVDVDRHGRVYQKSREYTSISILDPNTAGRGGSTVTAHYTRIENMSDSTEKIQDGVLPLNPDNSTPECTMQMIMDELKALGKIVGDCSVKYQSLAHLAESDTKEHASGDKSIETTQDMQAEYTRGFAEGQAQAQTAANLNILAQRRGITLKSAKHEDRVNELLTAFGVECEYSAHHAAIAALMSVPITPTKAAQDKPAPKASKPYTPITLTI